MDERSTSFDENQRHTSSMQISQTTSRKINSLIQLFQQIHIIRRDHQAFHGVRADIFRPTLHQWRRGWIIELITNNQLTFHP